MNANILQGKVAVVTGGASGIGKCVTELFVSEGAKVYVIDANAEKVALVKRELQGVTGICLDICDEDQVKDAFSTIVEQAGHLDILVNSAGIFRDGAITEADFHQWKTILDVNLNGTFLTVRHAAQQMAAQAGGSIINIGSEAGIVGIAGQVAYNVSKAGVIALTKSAAVDLAQKNVRVNCICPGRVRTPLVDAIIESADIPQAMFETLSYDRPAMRMGDPQEIAYACLMFASDRMTYATGSIFSIDGGYTAR